METSSNNGNNLSMQKYNFAPPPSYQQESRLVKLKRRINHIFINKIANTPFQFKAYFAYWHYIFNKDEQASTEVKQSHFIYLKPNYGAGIGHQLANWNAGLYFAEYFKNRFAHFPFSNNKWETFLGFNEGETLVLDLNKKNFKTVNLPKFDSENQEEVNLIGKIINSYKQPNILFKLEMDQGYMRQFDTSTLLSQKFFSAPSRVNDKLLYLADSIKIAVHIRRRMAIETEEIWQSRGLNNAYFVNALKNVLSLLNTNKNVEIFLFSQGTVEDFPEFKHFVNLKFMLDMGPVDSFLHMVYADVLISSKSSFSYKPSLISKGIKICPESFWHGYPPTADYILADNQGNFNKNNFLLLLNMQGINKQVV